MYYKQFISAKYPRVSTEKVLLELVGGRRNLKTEVSLWRRTKRFPSTLRQRNFKTEVSLWKCTKYFPSKLRRRRNLKMQQSSVILDLCLRKTRARISHRLSWHHRFGKAFRRSSFSFTRKQKTGLFKFLRFEDRFRKAPYLSQVNAESD